tara:strand:+ start:581 stop:1363 length:783 start_codon:yes stop_codon:yes gene_type:complete
MTEADRIDRIARHLYDSHGARANFQNLTGDMALGSIDEAYQVQLALDRMWTSASRGPIGGYKIALTSKAIQDLVGVDKPCVGAIFASSIFHSPAEIPISKFVRLGLEFETAFRMGRELPEGETFDQYSISKYVDTAMAAFELIEDGSLVRQVAFGLGEGSSVVFPEKHLVETRQAVYRLHRCSVARPRKGVLVASLDVQCKRRETGFPFYLQGSLLIDRDVRFGEAFGLGAGDARQEKLGRVVSASKVVVQSRKHRVVFA